MISKVRKTVEYFEMLRTGDLVLAAVSGGPDSVALIGVLRLLADPYRLKLVMAHFNHGLRGEESEDDERFVRRLSDGLGIPLVSGRMDERVIENRKGKSLEEASRDERYRFLEKAGKSVGATRIALGHNRSDQAETVFMNILRGSGLQGLKGMLPVRADIYIRPLIRVTRQEIYAFLKKENMAFVHDSTNSQDVYFRNRIRNRLIPEIKDNFDPQFERQLCRMAEIVRVENDFIQENVNAVLNSWGLNGPQDQYAIEIGKVRSLHPALQYRLILAFLHRCSHSDKGFGYDHARAIVELIHRERPSGILELPHGVRVEKDYDHLMIEKGCVIRRRRIPKAMEGISHAKGGLQASDTVLHVEVPGTVDIESAGVRFKFDIVGKKEIVDLKNGLVFMDHDRIDFPLFVRNFRPGDRMQPLGMEGTKKIKEIFIEKKISRDQRGKIPLLVDRSSVLWIMGIHLSDRVKIREETETAVRVEIV